MAMPSHKPSDDSRKRVKALSAYGIPHADIARHIGIDAKTLRKYYDNELALGTVEANAKVAQTLYEQAISGNTAAMIFWLKSRAGWREKQDVEHSGTIEVVRRHVPDA